MHKYHLAHLVGYYLKKTYLIIIPYAKSAKTS